MTKAATINVADLIGTSFAVATDDAMKVFEVLEKKLQKGEVVTLSFEGVEMLTTSFVNPCIALLYKTISPSVIASRLKFEGIFPEDLEKIKRAMERGAEYFANPELFEPLLVTASH